MTQSNKKGKFTWSRFFTFFALAGVLTTGITFTASRILNQSVENAQAASAFDMDPGTTAKFKIRYSNSGDQPLENGVLKIYVGDELEVKTSTITDEFNGGPANLVNPSLVKTDDPNWGSVIEYTPGTATSTTTPGGNANGASVGINDTGRVSFEATLKNDVTTRYSATTINTLDGQESIILLTPDLNNQGVRAILESDNAADTITDDQPIRVPAAANPLPNFYQSFELESCTPNPANIDSDKVDCTFLWKINDASQLPVIENILYKAVISKDIVLDLSIEQEGLSTGECQQGAFQSVQPVNPSNWYTSQATITCEDIDISEAVPGLNDVSLISSVSDSSPLIERKTLLSSNIDRLLLVDETETSNSLSKFSNQTVNCTNPTIIGQTTDCTFTFKENLNSSETLLFNYANSVQAKIMVNSITSKSGTCNFTENNVTTESKDITVTCTGIDSTGGSLGLKNINLVDGEGNELTFANAVYLIYEEEETIVDGGCSAYDDECRLYFQIASNTTLNWDTNTQFNIGYPNTNKFKDGPVTLIMDEIKVDETNYIPDGSQCEFEIYNYSKNTLLTTLTGTTTGGKCQTVIPVSLQNINYWRIIAIATDSSTNKTYKVIDTLVLAVGG